MPNNEPRMCNVARKEISAETCYEIWMCLIVGFDPASIPEANFKDDERTERICERCPHHHDWD